MSYLRWGFFYILAGNILLVLLYGSGYVLWSIWHNTADIWKSLFETSIYLPLWLILIVLFYVVIVELPKEMRKQ